MLHHINSTNDMTTYFKPVTTRMDLFPTFNTKIRHNKKLSDVLNENIELFTQELDTSYKLLCTLFTTYMLEPELESVTKIFANCDIYLGTRKKKIEEESTIIKLHENDSTSNTGTETNKENDNKCKCDCDDKCSIREKIDPRDKISLAMKVENKFSQLDIVVKNVTIQLTGNEFLVNAPGTDLNKYLFDKNLMITKIVINDTDVEDISIQSDHDQTMIDIKKALEESTTYNHRHIWIVYAAHATAGSTQFIPYELEAREAFDKLEEGVITPYIKEDTYTIYISIAILEEELVRKNPRVYSGDIWGMRLFTNAVVGGEHCYTGAKAFNRHLHTSTLGSNKFIQHHNEDRWLKGVELDDNVVIIKT